MKSNAVASPAWSFLSGLPVVTLSIMGMCLLAFTPLVSHDQLELQRGAIVAGEWWRLVTGHLAHWDASHLFWDGVVFVALGSWLEKCNWRSYVGLLVAAAVVVSIGVWHLLPELENYRGLSGIDTTLFVVVATTYLVDCVRTGNRRMALVAGGLMVGLGLKTLFETVTGGTIFVDAAAAGFAPVPLAHLLGAAVGIAFVWLTQAGPKPNAGGCAVASTGQQT